MTAPNVESPAPTEADILANDDLIAAALSSRVERNQHVIPDEPNEAPPATEAPDKAADPPPVDPAKAESTTSTTPEPASDAPADPASVVDPFGALLPSAKPLTYKVNGTERTFDGILELPDGKGALVPPDKVAELRNLVSRYDSNAEAYREFKGKLDAYDARFGGMDGITAKLELAAQTDAAALTILDAIRTDPTQFVTVVDGQIVPNKPMIDLLTRTAAVNAKDAKWQVRQEWEHSAQTAQRSASDAEVRATAVPGYLTQAHTDLHADDRAFLERRAAQYLFPADKPTAQAYGVPEGTLMLAKEDLDADVAHLKSLRTEATKTQAAAQQASAAAVKAAEHAAKENARRNPVPAPKPTAAATPPRDKETGQFKRGKRLDTAEIFERSLRGDAIGSPQLTE